MPDVPSQDHAFIWHIRDCDRNRPQPFRKQASPNTCGTEYNGENVITVYPLLSHNGTIHRNSAMAPNSTIKLIQDPPIFLLPPRYSTPSIFPHCLYANPLLPKHIQHVAVNR